MLVENYILEIKAHRIVPVPPVHTAPKIEYVVPPEMQTRIAFLGQENERLTGIISQLELKIKSQRPVIEYTISPDIQKRLDYLEQENIRSSGLIIHLEQKLKSQVPVV